MKPTAVLLLTILLSVASPLVAAHDLPYFQVTVPGNPSYVVAEGFSVRTIEKQVPIDGGVFSEYWEFTGGRIVYMTFIRRSRGESFEVISPRKDVGLTPETTDELRRASQIIHLYLSSEVP